MRGMQVEHSTGRSESSAYLEAIAAKLKVMTGAEIASRVAAVVASHETWRGTRLNLVASDNLMSRGARRLLDSDLATRVSEGMPGARDHPPSPISKFADELEGIVILLVRQLFGVPYVEWRPQSTSLANALALWSLTQPGDTVMVQAGHNGGGNFGYQHDGLPTVRGLDVITMPVAEHFGIDLDRLRPLALRARPRVYLIGGGSILFPYPLMALRDIADETDATIIYDAAHVGLLIATGHFQDAFREGANVMTAGTHKIASGPVGGLVMTHDQTIAEHVASLAYPGLVQTRDQNKFAAAAVSLAEMVQFGHDYALQSIRNAQALGAALAAAGFKVLAADRGYTKTHQVFVDLSHMDVVSAVNRLIAGGVLVHATRLPNASGMEPANGLRISVQEATRRGMLEPQMATIAECFKRLVIDRKDGLAIAGEIADLMRQFHEVAYSFDSTMGLASR